MKYFLISAFLALTVASPILGNVAESRKEFTFSFETNETNACGGVLREASGQIVYKPFTEVGPNERCVWIVAGPRAYSYNIRVAHFGHEASEGLLSVSEVSLRPRLDYSMETITPTDTNTFALSGSALVVTFHSKEAGATGGFVLEYSVAEETATLSPNSEYFVVGADTVFSRYPSQREEYDDDELGIFAIPPVANVYVQGRSRQVIYGRIELENCYDIVSFYSFNAASNSFIVTKYFCDSVNTELISHDDISLVVFRTGSNRQRYFRGIGFALTFPSCA